MVYYFQVQELIISQTVIVMDDLNYFFLNWKNLLLKLFIFKNKKLKTEVFNFSILKVKTTEFKLCQVKGLSFDYHFWIFHNVKIN